MSHSLRLHGLYSLPDFSVHGVLQSRVLEWIAIPFSRISFQLRDWTWVFCIVGGFFTIWATRETHLFICLASIYLLTDWLELKARLVDWNFRWELMFQCLVYTPQDSRSEAGRVSMLQFWENFFFYKKPVNDWICCCCWATKSCPTIWNPMDCSTPGFPILHCLPEFAQTYVHWTGDAIQPSYPLSPTSPPVLKLPQHQSIFQWVSSLHQVATVLELQLQHQSFQWIFRAK